MEDMELRFQIKIIYRESKTKKFRIKIYKVFNDYLGEYYKKFICAYDFSDLNAALLYIEEFAQLNDLELLA